MEHKTGEIVPAKITRITAFGAFAELEGGTSGLIHISQLANEYVRSVEDFVQLGQQVQVKILPSGADGKIALSLKQAAEPAAAPARPAKPARTGPAPRAQQPKQEEREGDPFEAKLARFMKDSNEKQTAVTRQRDNHRSR